MAPQFGNFFPRKKTQRDPANVPEQSLAQGSDPLSFLANQSIRLSRDEIKQSRSDFAFDKSTGETIDVIPGTAVLLHWDRLDGEMLLLRVALIEGLQEGVPRIAAGRLYGVAPALFDSPPPDVTIHLRLAAIVSQLANLLPEAPEPPETVDQSFETPFHWQAEAEQARIREQQRPPPLRRPDAARNLFPPQTDSGSNEVDFEPGDRPQIPLEILREQNLTQATLAQTSPDTQQLPPDQEAALTEPQPSLAPSLSPSSPAPISQPAPLPVTLEEKKLSAAPAQMIPKRSSHQRVIRRAAIERLQEIFLLEEELDGPRVTEEILKLPKILGALVMRDQAVLGCLLPEGFDPKPAMALNRLIEQLTQFSADFGAERLSSLTISAKEHITLVSQGAILVLVIHHGRLVPGVREKLVESAEALDALYNAFEP